MRVCKNIQRDVLPSFALKVENGINLSPGYSFTAALFCLLIQSTCACNGHGTFIVSIMNSRS